MPGHVSQRIDGHYSRRGPLAPEERSPIPLFIEPGNVPAFDENSRVYEFPDWVRWVFVEEADAFLQFEDTSGNVSVRTAGGFLILPDKKIRMRSADVNSPSLRVKLLGLSHEDALILSSAARSSTTASGSSTHPLVTDAPKNSDPAAILVPESGPGIRIFIIHDENDDTDELLWLTDTGDVPGVGVPISTGGNFTWDGFLYVSATANGGAGSDAQYFGTWQVIP